MTSPAHTDSLGQTYALLPAGTFHMGSTPEQAERALTWRPGWQSADAVRAEHAVEMPRHRVTLSRPFLLAHHTVTVDRFRAFIEATGHIPESIHDGRGGTYYVQGKLHENLAADWQNPEPDYRAPDDEPVTQVTYHDALAFCSWLTAREGRLHRLPTEAEWEYACRAGTDTLWPHGDDPDALSRHAVRDAARPSPVGRRLPNAFGLYDLLGNVWEWTADLGAPDTYARGDVTDPTGPVTGSAYVRRGGAFNVSPNQMRSAYRKWSPARYRGRIVGFRVAAQAGSA
jgi:formylglycine-generating enzyme required for sulfatase activity